MSTVSRDRAESPFILSLDIGTSSVRAAIFDRLGRAVEGLEARQRHEIRTTKDGASETDADALLERVWRCIDEVLGRMGHLKDQVRGVGICTFVGNILGVDRDRRAITPLTTYADTRSEGEVVKLRVEFDETVVHDRTGCHFHPAYLPAFFRWFARDRRGTLSTRCPVGFDWRISGVKAFRGCCGELFRGFVERALRQA